ncbi:TfuA-like protein [Actinomadura sp. WMMA1423]|uniref:TfuA-like protein n=1 Tax=Actinomadura sp. WMMA1423 TaxID=2591108 RepID=UPI00114750A0|nr:TfuA-like protein [Actinomadura sp. WMMA1423]
MNGPGTFLFLGPTGHGMPRELLDVEGMTVLPPARRGAVAALLDTGGPPGEIVIVDGRFGDVLAVGHREILAALDAGWTVWGVSSMGAIRAAELHDHGMKGFGVVYRRFVEQMIPDDQVAVLHGPAPEYRPFSEALIDLGSFLEHLAGAELLRPAHARKVQHALAGRWFAERTVSALTALCGEVAGPDAVQPIRKELPKLPDLRLKSADLRAFLMLPGRRQNRGNASGQGDRTR